jgi:hypothetical protein
VLYIGTWPFITSLAKKLVNQQVKYSVLLITAEMKIRPERTEDITHYRPGLSCFAFHLTISTLASELFTNEIGARPIRIRVDSTTSGGIHCQKPRQCQQSANSTKHLHDSLPHLNILLYGVFYF